MLNRRNFLKTGLTAGAGIVPLTSALNGIDGAPPLSAQQPANVDTAGVEVELVSLPQRLPARDQSAIPWQQKIRRVGQTNIRSTIPPS